MVSIAPPPSMATVTLAEAEKKEMESKVAHYPIIFENITLPDTRSTLATKLTTILITKNLQLVINSFTFLSSLSQALILSNAHEYKLCTLHTDGGANVCPYCRLQMIKTNFDGLGHKIEDQLKKRCQ